MSEGHHIAPDEASELLNVLSIVVHLAKNQLERFGLLCLTVAV